MTTSETNKIDQAIEIVREASKQETRGQWLEDLVEQIAPDITDWDIAKAFAWDNWPERNLHFPMTTKQDVGIDVVAVRRSDSKYIAIQCKARKLDENARGTDIIKGEIDKFANASAGSFWSERWLVTNGDVRDSGNIVQVVSMHDKPLPLVNIAADLALEKARRASIDLNTVGAETDSEECPHCLHNPEGEKRFQTKNCMQKEAIDKSVATLREHELTNSGGIPRGQARGRIILPCGTGKTRISLRITEKLTPPGELAIVLCPSIALVAQIRREYIQHTTESLRPLAVCSDETAGYDPKNEGKVSASDNPAVDNSNVSAQEIRGKVTTNSNEIADWINEGRNNAQINVIFGTYQSSHRIGEALIKTGTTATVLIADEAHRTAGIKSKKNLEEKLRDFTVCHDQTRFPVKYRIYQTATPRVYDTTNNSRIRDSNWIVRSMDDETVFGVELYRRSYMEAVENGWLADYRIIALGINDRAAYDTANNLANNYTTKGNSGLTSAHFLKGMTLALVLGGATNTPDGNEAVIKSCISFMNTVEKSKGMAEHLQSQTVKNWVQRWLNDNRDGQIASDYSLEHLDASSKVTTRDQAKKQLIDATEEKPRAIVNVGIFGEGTDAPSLSAVAFLEARKSPIDVIQAVGRAMRTAEDKQLGYIICPIYIPPNVDAEKWLQNSGPEDGWRELGQILLALRAHDSRIEDNLTELMEYYLPVEPEEESTFIALASNEDGRINYYGHVGKPGEAEEKLQLVLQGEESPRRVFIPASTLEEKSKPQTQLAASQGTEDLFSQGNQQQEQNNSANPTAVANLDLLTEENTRAKLPEPGTILAGKKNSDSSLNIRIDSVSRGKPNKDGTPGPVDFAKTKAKGKDMINKDKGNPVPTEKPKRPRLNAQERNERNVQMMLHLTKLDDNVSAIAANLLAKSGLSQNRVMRDLNILESSVREAAHHLREDQLQTVLDRHFMLDNLDEKVQKDIREGKAADGCVTAALLMMNAAMLHQRIASGRWLLGISELSEIKNDVNVVRTIRQEWERIMRRDFHPVLEPAVDVIDAVERTGKLGGLERALHHLTAEAERIAEAYADMGADHAGPLFNKVMGNQASDGAYFTRPVAASIAARLTLDACGNVDWTNPDVWRAHKTVDLACGSGTLLAAILTDMKRRAREQDATETQITELQRIAVEETIKGLDINPISLQLAASQLTAGNHEIRYRHIGLELMPYGPKKEDPSRVSVGTLELLGQSAIVPRHNEMDLGDDQIASQTVWTQHDDAELENAVDAVKDAHIVIMNPPFTNRSKMGGKFPKEIQKALLSRADDMERTLVSADPDLKQFGDKNSIMPLFVALAGHCLEPLNGLLTMIEPTIALSAPSALKQRQILAERYHIHTVLTGRWPREFTLSQNVEIDECMVIAARQDGVRTPTRFIHLDRMPHDEEQVAALHQALKDAPPGMLADGWGEVAEWPQERMAEGDWTPAIWRSPELAEAARHYAKHTKMRTIQEHGYSCNATLQMMDKKNFIPAELGCLGSFPIISSKGGDGQKTIQSTPDSEWLPTNADEEKRLLNGGTYPEVDMLLEKAGYLLVTSGQAPSTARLTAIASVDKYVGRAFLPITGPTAPEAKSIAVFINSTPGRLQLLSNAGRKIAFSIYNPKPIENLRIPNVKDARIRQVLADCWERTKNMVVPQFRDGECEVRRLWDQAVAEAMGWDATELERLRHLLHQEPHVRGLGYGQFADADSDPETDC